MKKVPVREQDPKVRATNFEEVCYGYNKEEAMAEAERCLHCKNAKCMMMVSSGKSLATLSTSRGSAYSRMAPGTCGGGAMSLVQQPGIAAPRAGAGL